MPLSDLASAKSRGLRIKAKGKNTSKPSHFVALSKKREPDPEVLVDPEWPETLNCALNFASTMNSLGQCFSNYLMFETTIFPPLMMETGTISVPYYYFCFFLSWKLAADRHRSTDQLL